MEPDRQHDQIHIREAEITDIFALTSLMNELGYEVTPDDMKIRFTNIQNHQDYKTYVAENATEVVGLVGMTRNYFYEQNGMYVRVLALVVHGASRQKGVGRKLMKASEEWATEIGATAVFLNCGSREERTVARQFYQSIGYEIKSSGFIKKL